MGFSLKMAIQIGPIMAHIEGLAKHPKRPLDPNQWAKAVIELATMDEGEMVALKKTVVEAIRQERSKKQSHTPGKRGARSSNS